MCYIRWTLDTKTPVARGRGRSPSLAAALSFLWPGLGQFYTGNRREAVLFAIPPVLVTLALLYVLRQGPVVFAARIFAERALGLATVLVIIVAGAWRLVSIARAYTSVEPRPSRKVLHRLVVGGLAGVIIVTHLSGGFVILAASNAGSHVFTGNNSLIDEATPVPSGATPAPTISIVPVTPPPDNTRVTILFTGVDAAPNRGEHLYDSIMVVSFDPKTNSVQMVSVPRDSASFPLYFGGQVKVTTRINSLPTYVSHGWVRSPDPPYMTLVKEVAYLVGIPINYYAVMDLNGFVKMIDLVGGIDVNNPNDIADPSYNWLNGKPTGFFLKKGPQHLDGLHALAYVRSRHGTANNDWKRASRQQEVLVSLLHKMSEPGNVLALPSIIDTLGASISTNFPADKVGDYVARGLDVPKENFKQIVLGPPYTILGVNDVSSASTSCLLNSKVAELSIQLFGTDSTWYGKKAPANTCP
jgi:LCP family protein required for cell wall assembly